MAAFMCRFYLFTSSLSLSSSYWNINLANGNIVIVDKFSALTRYIIIAIQRSSTDEIIKRIIGIPGDSIKVHDNELTLHLGNEPHSPTEIFWLSPEVVAQMNHSQKNK